MAIDVEVVNDKHQLILDISVVDEEKRHAKILITYAESDASYKLETRPLGATMTIKEGTSRRKAVLRFSGLPFPPRNLPNRCIVFSCGLRPDEPRTAATLSRA